MFSEIRSHLTLCVCYDYNRCYVSVCTFRGILFLKLVPGSDFQFSGGQLTKKKKTKKSVQTRETKIEHTASNIVIRELYGGK